MPTVEVEKIGYALTVSVNGEPMLETGLDLLNQVVLSLPELLEVLEEASDEAVTYIDTEE